MKSPWLNNSEYSHILRVCKAINRCIFLYVEHLNISESRAGKWVTGNAALPFHLRTAIQAKTRVKMMTFEFFMTFKKVKSKNVDQKTDSHHILRLNCSLQGRGVPCCFNEWLRGERKVFSHSPLTETDTSNTLSPTKNTRLPQTHKYSHFLPA